MVVVFILYRYLTSLSALSSPPLLFPFLRCCYYYYCLQPHAHFSIWRQLMIARFIMGLGVGGEYPMAATITAELSEPDLRGRNVSMLVMIVPGRSGPMTLDL